MRTQRRDISNLLLVTEVLPLAVMALGAWEHQRGEADWIGLDAERLRLVQVVASLEARAPPDGRLDFAMQFRRGGQTYAGPLALTQAREARREVASLARGMDLRRLLPPVVTWTAGLAAGLSGLVLLAGAVLGRLGRTSREVLVRGFTLVRRLLPVLLGLQIVLGTMAFVGVVCFEVAALFQPGIGIGEVKLLLLAGIAVLGSLYAAGATLAGLRSALTAFEPDPLSILGRPVSPAEAPGLWRLVDGLADRLGALKPEAIVVGLTGSFFVSAGPKMLQPGGGMLSGRTLYVPLPYLPLLRLDEFAAIIGHELAHFAGGDTAYSLRFLPIYAGVGRSLDAVFAARGSGFGLLGPPLRLGLFVMDRFHHAVRHWSRRREFAADAAGAGPASAEAAVRALLRVDAVERRIVESLAGAAADVARAPDDLVVAVFDHASARGLDDPAAHLEAEQAHPTDTHPPTRERIAALGLSATPDLLAAAIAVPSREALGRLAVYLADPGEVCRAATIDFLAVARRDHDAVEAEIEAAAAAVRPEEQAFTTSMRGAGFFLLAFGIPLLGTAILLLLAGVPGTSLEELRLVTGAAGTLGAVFSGFGLFYLVQGRRVWLVLGPERLALTGLDRPIAWDDIADLDMAWSNNRVTMRLLLPPDVPLPGRHPGARRIRVDAARRMVVVKAVLPRRVKPRDVVDVIVGYRRAAQARRLLAERRGEVFQTARGAAEPQARGAVPPSAEPPAPPRLPPARDGWRHALWFAVGILMFGAFLVTALVFTAPALISDWAVHGVARPIAGAHVTEGNCNSQLVLQVCDVRLVVPTAAGAVSRRVSFAFVGVHVGDYAVRIVADPARPELATIDLALDRLWNRTITLLAGVALLLGLTILPLVAFARNRRRAAHA